MAQSCFHWMDCRSRDRTCIGSLHEALGKKALGEELPSEYGVEIEYIRRFRAPKNLSWKDPKRDAKCWTV